MSEIKRLTHVRTRADLLTVGFTDRSIRRALSAGQMRKLGRNWYGTSATPSDVAGALARGHRLTCVSALAVHGVFVVETPGPHEVGRQCSCATSDELILHQGLRAWPDGEPIMPVAQSLIHAGRCLDAEGAAVCLESALNKKLIGPDDVPSILAGLPARKRLAIGTLDGRAMSGPETRVRRLFERRGVQITPQFPLPDGGFADMLVGERLIIECDSRGHHTDREAFANDRHRDQHLVLLGYTVVRLTYQDVMDNWTTTREMLLSLLRRGVHRAPRPHRRRRIGLPDRSPG